jgi:formylglycine-generating enzyme required for sulfatase activity
VIQITVAGEAGYILKSDSLRIEYENAGNILYDKPYTFIMPEADVTVNAEFMPYSNFFNTEGDVSGNSTFSMAQILDSHANIYPFNFPYNLTDESRALKYSYWIADAEVSYELWDIVREWATKTAESEGETKVYTFVNSGARGGGVTIQGQARGSNHPVTNINWYDALVWCNALTEWYNETYTKTLTPAYQNEAGVLRDATATEVLDAVVPKNDVNGFRLPTSHEWELAARWRKDMVNSVSGFLNHTNYTDYFTAGKYASGVNSPNGADAGKVGVYGATSTLPVKSKLPNALGLYDMSGNVYEMCFDKHPTEANCRIMKGQAWSNTDMTIGYMGDFIPTTINDSVGFRVVRLDVPVTP